jgi:esterase/lipase superfamily enzyme
LLVSFAHAPALQAQTVPTPEVLRKFAEFESLLEEGQPNAFDVADDLLDTSSDTDMRLTIGRLALQSGQGQRAIDYLTPLVTQAAFDAADPRATDVLDLLSDAHRSLGQMAQALQFDLLAFNAAEARLGPENASLLQRLARIEQRYDPLPAEIQAAILALRTRLENIVPPADLRAEGDPTAVQVWYGTNRVPSGDADPATYFGSDLGPLTVGSLTVTIPPGHLAGLIERPTGWFFTDHLDPKVHVVLAEIEQMTRDAFAEGCCAADDKLLFVHGYNVTFHDGALRAGQLAFDLEFPGQAMYYSWPSKATLYGYLSDARNVDATRPAFVEFLELATRGTGKLHVVAHSMGNRYTLEALYGFFDSHPERRLGQLILAAPDVDRAEFEDRFDAIRARTDGVTLYASQNDLALMVSRGVNLGRRLGDAAGDPVVLSGMDTIDASRIEADMLGHSYFADAPELLGDILGLVRNGWAADERCGIVARQADGIVWDAIPQGCPVENVRTASDLIRLHGDAAMTVAQRRYEEAPGDQLDFWLGVMDVVRQRLEQ